MILWFIYALIQLSISILVCHCSTLIQRGLFRFFCTLNRSFWSLHWLINTFINTFINTLINTSVHTLIHCVFTSIQLSVLHFLHVISLMERLSCTVFSFLLHGRVQVLARFMSTLIHRLVLLNDSLLWLIHRLVNTFIDWLIVSTLIDGVLLILFDLLLRLIQRLLLYLDVLLNRLLRLIKWLLLWFYIWFDRLLSGLFHLLTRLGYWLLFNLMMRLFTCFMSRLAFLILIYLFNPLLRLIDWFILLSIALLHLAFLFLCLLMSLFAYLLRLIGCLLLNLLTFLNRLLWLVGKLDLLLWLTVLLYLLLWLTVLLYLLLWLTVLLYLLLGLVNQFYLLLNLFYLLLRLVDLFLLYLQIAPLHWLLIQLTFLLWLLLFNILLWIHNSMTTPLRLVTLLRCSLGQVTLHCYLLHRLYLPRSLLRHLDTSSLGSIPDYLLLILSHGPIHLLVLLRTTR